MKKRILSVLLAFAMIFTFMPTALAAPTTYQVVTVDKTTVQAGETVNVKVTLPEGIETAGSFTVSLNFDKTLFEVTKFSSVPFLTATDGDGETAYVSPVKGTKDSSNENGSLDVNAAYIFNTMEVAGVTVIDATLKAKATGTAAFSFTTFEITKSESGSTVWIVKDTDLEAPPSVTIPKSPITSVTASVDAPVKGQPLDTTVDIGTATGYTAAVEWYEGTTATGSPVTGKAKPSQFYYAKITLKANTGESFADTLATGIMTSEGYEITRVSDTELLLTHSFPKTGSAVVTEVRIGGTAPSLNVPEALGIDQPGTVKVTNTYSVTVFMDGSPVVNPSGVKWSVSDLKGVTVDPATGDMTISSDCPGGGITLTATYGGVSSTPATLTVWRATPAAKWLKIVDLPTGGTPKTTIMLPVGDDTTDMVEVGYEAKVYDQFSKPVTIERAYWTLDPMPTKIGADVSVNQPIQKLRVTHNTQETPFDLTAALETGSAIKDTIRVELKSKTPETLTVTQADTTYGTALAAPVFTAPEGTIKTTVHYSTPHSSAYSSDTPPTNAGEYVVNVLCETATHIYMGDASFKIEPKSLSNMLQPITGTYTYTGAPQKPEAVVKDGEVTLVKDKDYTVRYGTNVHVFEAATVYVEGKGNYTGTFSRNFKIQPKPIDITSAVAVNRDYEEGRLDVECTVTLPVAAEVKQGEHYHVYATMADDTAGTNKTVNVLVKMEKGGLGENYTLNKDTTTATVSINPINPADPTGLKGVKGQKLFTVELPAGWTWYAPSMVMDTAGTQTFLVNYTGDANHNSLHMHPITVNVLDKTDVSAFITFPDGEKEYTGSWMEYKEATISGTNLGAGAKWDYVYTAGTGTLLAGYPQGIGTYTVTATYEDSINFGIATATLTIVPKKVAIPAADTTVFTYDGNAKTYGIADTADYTVTGNSQTNAGDHTVTVALKDKATTAWADGTTADKTYTFTIKQATPTGEPAYTKITTSGKKLSDAALTTTGSTFSVPGTVKWVDDTGAALPDTTTVEANKLYKWVFTPTDSTNYESINGSIKLWSKSTSSGGGSYYAPVVPDMPMVYWGCTGDAVKTLQEKLNAKGFDSGNVDGIFGAKTYAAVTAFQKANSLGVDGIVGKLTWAKLYDATPVNVTPVTTQPMLRTGSRGDAVRKLQELLNAKGYTCGSVDGIFGSKTYAAVLAFQKANGLAADGIVGSLTWGKLV